MKPDLGEGPVADYRRAVDAAVSFADLTERIKPFKLVANDALLVARKASENDWIEFKRGLAQERRRSYAGDDWNRKYGAIILPSVMGQVTIVCMRFKAPWWICYRRMVEEKIIKEDKAHSIARMAK